MFQNLLLITADQDIVPFDKNTFKVRQILVEKRQRTLLNQRIKTYHKLVPKSFLIFLPFFYFREVIRRSTVILFTNKEDSIIVSNKGGDVYRSVKMRTLYILDIWMWKLVWLEGNWSLQGELLMDNYFNLLPGFLYMTLTKKKNNSWDMFLWF